MALLIFRNLVLESIWLRLGRVMDGPAHRPLALATQLIEIKFIAKMR
jgi:hypothetical protein